MTNRRRVVVTGLGMISPCGYSVDEDWNALLEGRSGIKPIPPDIIPLEELAKLPMRFAGAIPNFEVDFNDRRLAQRTSKHAKFFFWAAQQAMQQANFTSELATEEPEMFGCIVGSNFGDMDYLLKQTRSYLEGISLRGRALLSVIVLPNNPSAVVAKLFGLMGVNFAIGSACASGGHAIGEAADKIRLGKAKVILAGGAEAAINGMIIESFVESGAHAKSNDAEDPTKISRPGDIKRTGFILSEGAACVLLEDLEFALDRGAKPLAEVIGYFGTDDAYDMVAPHPDGLGQALAMKMALREACLEETLEAVDFLNLHFTSTDGGDVKEKIAVVTVFGDYSPNLTVTATKGNRGHLLGGAGAAGVVDCVNAIQTGLIPAMLNLDDLDPRCEGLDYVRVEPRRKKVTVALSNCFGFGGANASIVLRNYEA